MKKTMKNNIIMSIILTISNFLFPLVTYSYVARVLTPVGTGKVAFVNSVLSFFACLAVIGVPTYGLRECAKVRDDKTKFSKLVQELLIINIITTLLSYLILIVLIITVPKLFEYRQLFMVMGIYLFLNTIGLEWVYKSLEEYSYITIRSLIFKTITVILILFFIKSIDDYLLYGFLSIFALSASYVYNFIHIRKHVYLFQKNKLELKKHLKPVLLLFSATLIISIYSNFDITMLGFMDTETEVGLYNAAQKIKMLLLSLATAVTSAMIPRISYYMGNKAIDKVKKTIVSSARIALLFSIPFSFFGLVFSKEILLIICGDAYIGAANTMRVLMMCVAVLSFTNIFGNQLLIPLGYEKKFTFSVFVGLIINIVLNYLFIPKYGALGAAVATLITEIWNLLYMSHIVSEYRREIINEVRAWKYIVAYSIAIAPSILLFNVVGDINIIIKMVVTGGVYLILLYLSLIYMKEPLLNGELKKIIRFIKKDIK